MDDIQYRGIYLRTRIVQLYPHENVSIPDHISNPYKKKTQFISFCGDLDKLDWVINELKEQEWKHAPKNAKWEVSMVRIDLEDPDVIDVRDGIFDGFDPSQPVHISAKVFAKNAAEVLIKRTVTNKEICAWYTLEKNGKSLDQQIKAMKNRFGQCKLFRTPSTKRSRIQKFAPTCNHPNKTRLAVAIDKRRKRILEAGKEEAMLKVAKLG